MKDNAFKKVSAFLQKECVGGAPLLLGLSGGSDSMCLLRLLLEYRKEQAIELHLVHVDHGWRQESRGECEHLSKMAEKEGLLFHSVRLDPSQFQGNLEAESREARLQFFSSVQQHTGAQGILLGHHRGDQVETLLKRLFEGASVATLSGMQEITHMPNLTLFRPLLQVPKEEILQYLERHQVPFLDDATNHDPRFLRARMRQETIPFLQRSFGKDFSNHLLHLSEELAAVKEHFVERLRPIVEQGVSGPFGVMYSVDQQSGIECRYLLQILAAKHGVGLSHAEVQLGAESLFGKAANTWIQKKIYIDRGRLFFVEVHEGSWQIVKSEESVAKNSWQDVWRGRVATNCAVEYEIAAGLVSMRHKATGKVLDRYLTEKKVPRWVATLGPVLIAGGEVIEDFLTGVPCGGERVVLEYVAKNPSPSPRPM